MRRFTNYQALASNKIRLIKLLPGAEDTTIQLLLVQNVSLRETPSYNALLYTRGNPKTVQSVLIDGLEVDLTKDLLEFFWYRRQELDSEWAYSGLMPFVSTSKTMLRKPDSYHLRDKYTPNQPLPLFG